MAMSTADMRIMCLREDYWNTPVHRAMDNMFSILNIGDLNRASKMKTSLHNRQEIATREKLRRYYSQLLLLSDRTKLRFGTLMVIPHAALVIYDSDLEARHFVRRCFRQGLPNKILAVKVEKYLTSGEVQRASMPSERNSRHPTLNSRSTFNILALLFPNIEGRVCVDVAWEEPDGLFVYDVPSHLEDINYLAKELGLRDNDGTRSTFLFFSHSKRGFQIVNKLIRMRDQMRKDTIWTGMFTECPVLVKSTSDKDLVSNRKIVVMKLSGPKILSWSASIDCGCTRWEFDSKLEELKKSIKRKLRKCTGLFYSPARNVYGDSNEIMRNVKRVFPDVPFVGMFNSKMLCPRETSRHLLSDDYHRAMDVMTILIISYL